MEELTGKTVLITGGTSGIGRAYELARRLTGSGVTATVLHPGGARTNFGRADQTRTMRALTRLAEPFMKSPDQGAETVVSRVLAGGGRDQRSVLRQPEAEGLVEALV